MRRKIITPYELISVRQILLEKQNNVCPVCGEDILTDAIIDHDHETGFIRGAIHPWCNNVLGFIERGINREGHDRFFMRISDYITHNKNHPSGIVYPSKGQPPRFETKRVRIPRLHLTNDEKSRFKMALAEGAIPHPNPKKKTSREGSWNRTAKKYHIPYDRLLAYVNKLRPLTELEAA